MTQSILGRGGNGEFNKWGVFSNTSMTGPAPLSASSFSGGAGGTLVKGFEDYFRMVTTSSISARQGKYAEVLRFTPTNTLTSDSVRKSVYRKTLLPHYKTELPDSGFHYTNYQSFNFVS